MSYHSTLPLRNPSTTPPVPCSRLRERTRSTLKIQVADCVPFWAHLRDTTTSTPEPAPFAGWRPESPESSNLRRFGSTLRFFAAHDPFQPIAVELGDPRARVHVGGEVVLRNLASKLLWVYDALEGTGPRNHYFDVPRHAPSDAFELCVKVLSKYPPRVLLRPSRAMNILIAMRPLSEDILLLPDGTYIFRGISDVAIRFDEFTQLVALYARGDLLEAAQLMPALSRTIIARINHYHRIPFIARQLAQLLQLQPNGVADAVSAGPDYVVTAGVYSCTAKYADRFLKGRWQAQVRANPRSSGTPTFWDGLSAHVRARTGVTLLDEVIIAILKEERDTALAERDLAKLNR